jgi:hypothetical protein
MAVLVEGISVIVRRDAIETKYDGGWDAFVDNVPNATLCADDEIARVGFMGPADVEAFVRHLERNGLQFVESGKAIDLAIADQQEGPITECGWLEFAKIGFRDQGKVSACWFFDSPRIVPGIHLRGTSMDIATPAGWKFEDSLSHKFGFVPTGQENDRLEFLRSEDGIDVFLDLDSGKEVFVGRTSRHRRPDPPQP